MSAPLRMDGPEVAGAGAGSWATGSWEAGSSDTGAGDGAAASVLSSRFGVPAPGAAMTSVLVWASSFAETSAGLSAGFADSRSAAAPATCGAAMEVPLMVAFAVVELMPADAMPAPGAYRSTQGPKLEKEACRSEESLAATVKTSGTRAGELSQASTMELPAATATETPSA